MSQKGPEIISKQGLPGKDQIVQLDFCEKWVIAKQHINTFHVGIHSSKHIVDYLHVDLWGPANHDSHGENR